MPIQDVKPETIGAISDDRAILSEVFKSSSISNDEPEPKITPEAEPPIEPSPKKEDNISIAKETMGKELTNIFLGRIEEEIKAKLEPQYKAEIEKLKKESEESVAKERSDKSQLGQKTKELESKHKSELDGKNKEIESLKKTLAEKEKEVKSLFNQIKEALNE